MIPADTASADARATRRPRRAPPVGVVALVLAVGVVAIVLAAQRPPRVVGAATALADPSAERAAAHLSVIAREPHPVGTAALADVRDYLLAELGALGLETEVQRTTAVSQRFGVAALVENVLGRLRGTDTTGSVLLVAHYDSVTSGPGASDNGVAVAAVLEGLRALTAAGPLRNDVLVLFSDAEEVGLLGAEAFASEHPWMAEVSLVVNLEARGTSGPSVLVETQGGNRDLVRAFAANDPFPNASSMSFEIYRLLPNDTDFTVFKERGVPGFNFAYIRDLARYHTEQDDVAHASQRSLQHHAEHVVALARHFGEADLGAPLRTSGDAVYFDVLRLGMVHYPAALALPSALVAALAWVALTLAARSRGAVRLVGVTIGAVTAAVIAAAAGGTVFALLALLTWLEPAVRGAAMAAPFEAGITMSASAVAGVLVVVLGVYAVQRRLRLAEFTLGALAFWAALGVVVGTRLPGGSYLFVWPVLGGLAGLAVALRRRGADLATPSAWERAALLVGLLPALLLLPPFLAEGSVGLGLGLAPALVALIALAACLLAPLFGALSGASRAGLPLVLLVVATTLFVVGARSATYDAARPRPVNAFYAVDPVAGDARFLSFVADDDPWTSTFFADARSGDVRELLPDAPALRWAPAPVVALPVPEVSVAEDAVAGLDRMLTLQVASARDAARLTVLIGPATPVGDVLVNDRRLDRAPRANGWARIVVYGRVREGVRVGFTTRADADVALVVIDETHDLFDHDALGVPPRPAGTMAAPSRLSDAVLVVRSWSAPEAAIPPGAP